MSEPTHTVVVRAETTDTDSIEARIAQGDLRPQGVRAEGRSGCGLYEPGSHAEAARRALGRSATGTSAERAA